MTLDEHELMLRTTHVVLQLSAALDRFDMLRQNSPEIEKLTVLFKKLVNEMPPSRRGAAKNDQI